MVRIGTIYLISLCGNRNTIPFSYKVRPETYLREGYNNRMDPHTSCATFVVMFCPVASTLRYYCDSARLLDRGTFPIIKPCGQYTRADYIYMVLPASSKYINCVRLGTRCDLFLLFKEINC